MSKTENSSVWTSCRGESDALEVYLLGLVEFEAAMFLQDRLHREITQRRDRLGALLICEHPGTVTIGRQGSLLDLPGDPGELESRQIETRRVARGGGTLLHGPGQVVAYPILPVGRAGFRPVRSLDCGSSSSSATPLPADCTSSAPAEQSESEQSESSVRAQPDVTTELFHFVNRCTTAICGMALELRVNATVTADGTGVESRCGQFGWVGAAIRDGVSSHGLFVNVTPDLELFELISAPRPVSSLSMQKMRPVSMSKVRESLIRNLSSQFGYEDMHLYTRHPLLTRKVVEYA